MRVCSRVSGGKAGNSIMSKLCSARFGQTLGKNRKTKSSSGKSSVPLFGFGPINQLSHSPPRLGQRSRSPADIERCSTRSQLVLDKISGNGSSNWSETGSDGSLSRSTKNSPGMQVLLEVNQNGDPSRHMSPKRTSVEYATTDDIISVFSLTQPDLVPPSQKSLPASKGPLHLPKTYVEFEHQLAAASRVNPANIPVLVVEGFTPDPPNCRQMKVEPGMIMNAVYRVRNWVCVKTSHGHQGFVPMRCVKPIGVLPESDGTTSSSQVITYLDHSLNSSGHSQGQSPIGTQSYIYNLNSSGHSQGQSSIGEQSYNHSLNSSGQSQGQSPTGEQSYNYSLNSSGQSQGQSPTSEQSYNYSLNSSGQSQAQSPTGELSYSKNLNSSGHSQGKSSIDEQFYIQETTFCSCCPHEHIDDKQSEKFLNNCSENSYVEHSFEMEPERRICRLTVLFDYRASHFDDVSVYQDEVVVSLEDDHSDWIWVKKGNGEEGYIPKQYVVDMSMFNMHPQTKTSYF